MTDRSGRRARPGARAFVLLTVATSWTVWIATWLLAGRPAASDASRPMIAAIYAGSFAPGLVAALLSAVAGRETLRAWLRGFVRWRGTGPAWLAVALPLPLALVGLTMLLGYHPRTDARQPVTALFYLTLFPVSLFNGLATALFGAGPLGEEGGWRGFLLPRLAERHGQARAAVIVGVVWTAWHLPIMAMFADWRGGVPFAPYLPLYLAGLLALSLLFARVRALGGGALLPCIWLHGIVNATGGIAFDSRLWRSGWSAAAGAGWFAVAAWVAAGAVWSVQRGLARRT